MFGKAGTIGPGWHLNIFGSRYEQSGARKFNDQSLKGVLDCPGIWFEGLS